VLGRRGEGGRAVFFRLPHTLSAVLIVRSVLTFGSECGTLTKNTPFRTFDTRMLRRIYGPKRIMVYGDQGLILNL